MRMERRADFSTIGWRCLAIGLLAALGAQARPVVFVSIPPQAWLVKRLAGDAAEVQTLLAAGVNPHTYEPNSRQLRKLAEASLYLTVGMPFEAPLAERAAALNPSLAVAAMDTGIAKRGAHAHGHDHDHGAPGHVCGGAGGDPHIWLAPRLMCAMASNTVTALERALPALRPGLAGRLAATVADIRAVDDAVRERLAGLRTRTWVVYHPSWSYFAESYGLVLLAVEEDGKTPSARHLTATIRQAREAGVRVVFTEPQYDRRPVTALARQVGARLEVIDPLAEAWPELMRDVAAKLAAGDAP